MSNTRQSTSILRNCYNSRGMILHYLNAVCKNLVIEPDGTLWALIATDTNNIELRRSTDDGFSWEMVNDDRFVGTSTRANNLSINGAINNLVIMPNWDRITLFNAAYTAIPDYEVDYSTAVLSADLTDNSVWTDYQPGSLDTNEVVQAIHTVVYNSETAFIIYVDASGEICCARWGANAATAVSSPAKTSGLGITHVAFDAVCEDDGTVHALIRIGQNIKHITYDHGSNSWSGTTHAIDTLVTSGEMVDPVLVRDSYGTLLAVWGEVNAAGTDVDLRYSISTDDGVSWTTTDVAKASGYTAYFDSIKGVASLRCDAVGGQGGGFLMTYTQDNSSGVPKALVRELSTSDGVTYTLQAQQLAAPVGDSVVVAGAKFFKPIGTNLLSLEDKSLVRMAFQLQEGNSTVQSDTKPVHFDTEILKHSAYPNDLATESGSYSTDTAGTGEIVVTVNVLANTSNNVDFHALGMTGAKTELYEAAFDKMATECRILQYEPKENSQMSDRSSYDDPIEHCEGLIWEPLSYSFPTPDLTTTQQEDFVEQDIRKVYIRPDFHLSRTFLLNEGNFLKRTVWTAWFDGNEYELSQVIPHFMDNEICYYEANAYVVGPSRNPWSRVVLPSET